MACFRSRGGPDADRRELHRRRCRGGAREYRARRSRWAGGDGLGHRPGHAPVGTHAVRGGAGPGHAGQAADVVRQQGDDRRPRARNPHLGRSAGGRRGRRRRCGQRGDRRRGRGGAGAAHRRGVGESRRPGRRPGLCEQQDRGPGGAARGRRRPAAPRRRARRAGTPGQPVLHRARGESRRGRRRPATHGRITVKITAIRLDRMRIPLDPPFLAAWDPVPRRWFDATLVRVETDEGVTGFGSGDTMAGFGAYEELFVGRDPREIVSHVRAIEGIGFHASRYWPLEAALWDILGKLSGQPVGVLFGGAAASLPAYASFGELKSPGERAESVRAAREAVGDSVEIIVDLNQWWRMPGDISPALDVAGVRRLASELRDLGVLWLEEPLPGGDLAGMRMLREQTGIRVAGGEMARGPAELFEAISAGALDVVQPDAVLAVGMLRARTVAEFAMLRHGWFTPHTWTNGLGLMANLHVVAGVGGGPYVEFPYDPPGWTPQC